MYTVAGEGDSPVKGCREDQCHVSVEMCRQRGLLVCVGLA